jgi:hypothetical protein
VVDDHTSPSGPDPARVRSLDDLARELGLLRSRAARGTRSARVSLEELAARVGEPRSTIHAYISGKRLAPTQILDRIVIALGTTSAEQREWAEAWYRVDAHRDAAHRVADRGPARESVPRQLPSTVDTFIGRGEQIHQLDEMLSRRQSGAIAAISGTAGVGKTALALHWAQTRSQRFPDGQLYLDLRGFDPVRPIQPGQALARLLRVLGVRGEDVPRETDERAALYRSLLSGRRMLIVLDNSRDTEQLRSLLPGTPSCMVLATSRDSLTGLIVRHGARRIDLDALQLADATELLRALIAAQLPVAVLDLTEPDLAALAEQCARIPLALRIAAELAVARSGAPLGELVDELAAGHHELDLLGAGDDPRTALRAVLSWSYQWLAAPTARAFRLIGLHPGIDLTAEALAALTDTGMPEAHRTLGQLTRAHLLQQSRPGRYSTNSLLRSYAAELALAVDNGSERRAALNRLFEHYLHTAAEAMDLLLVAHGPTRADLGDASERSIPITDPVSARRWLDAERVNLLPVAERASRPGGPRQTARLAQAVAAYLDHGGQHADSLVVGLPDPLGVRARLVGC